MVVPKRRDLRSESYNRTRPKKNETWIFRGVNIGLRRFDSFDCRKLSMS